MKIFILNEKDSKIFLTNSIFLERKIQKNLKISKIFPKSIIRFDISITRAEFLICRQKRAIFLNSTRIPITSY